MMSITVLQMKYILQNRRNLNNDLTDDEMNSSISHVDLTKLLLGERDARNCDWLSLDRASVRITYQNRSSICSHCPAS